MSPLLQALIVCAIMYVVIGLSLAIVAWSWGVRNGRAKNTLKCHFFYFVMTRWPRYLFRDYKK